MASDQSESSTSSRGSDASVGQMSRLGSLLEELEQLAKPVVSESEPAGEPTRTEGTEPPRPLASRLRQTPEPTPTPGGVEPTTASTPGVEPTTASTPGVEPTTASTPGVEPSPEVLNGTTDTELVQVRLGVAAGLYEAIKAKHADKATHCLRVALEASAWATLAEIPQDTRNAIEIAALLHDIGIVGIPDQILRKPGPLTADEVRYVERSRRVVGLRILGSTRCDQQVLEIVENTGAWYDGGREGYSLQGKDIPLGSRMIAILEAYDAMTSDLEFRSAMTWELAMKEIVRCAGDQFDPDLVEQFAAIQKVDRNRLWKHVADRWLSDLDDTGIAKSWQRADASAVATRATAASPRPATGESSTLSEPLGPFHGRLVRNMHDAVAFVDAGLQIVQWNHGAERLTGLTASSVDRAPWTPGLVEMRDEDGQPVASEDCPVTTAIREGVQSLRQLTVRGRKGEPLAVEGHTIPVASDDGTILGAVVHLHDVSSKTTLEQRCQNLYEKATKDPMTKVANRAEFDRVHETFVAHHNEQDVPCSLMMCDLDHFKKVNDNFGHQAGDEAIITMAQILKNACRPGDLAARYGGEEFVMLFADTDNATATERSEKIRVQLMSVPQPRMDGRAVTASFGVTEILPGDTADTMLRRADRALLMAKGNGRNQVVQLGAGSEREKDEDQPRPQGSTLEGLKQKMFTSVPLNMAIEKLRGFVADHRAKILKIDGNRVVMEIDIQRHTNRRENDRPMRLKLDLDLSEERVVTPIGDGRAPREVTHTHIHAVATPCKGRDRRRSDLGERAHDLLASIRSYLMAEPCEGEDGHETEIGQTKSADGLVGRLRGLLGN